MRPLEQLWANVMRSSGNSAQPKRQLIAFICLLFLMGTSKAVSQPVRADIKVAEEQAIASIREGSTAAYCLGSAEAGLSFDAEAISTLHQQNTRSDFFEKRALEKLSRIHGLLESIAKQPILSQGRGLSEILAARQEGLADAQQCFREQAAYIKCQEPCRIPGTNDFELSCTDKCTSPASCNNSKIISCHDLDARIVK
jgi:hypothetical protein